MNQLVTLHSGLPLPSLVASIETKLGNHSFRATGITAYLKHGGTLEKGRRDGEPCLNPNDAALRSPAQ